VQSCSGHEEMLYSQSEFRLSPIYDGRLSLTKQEAAYVDSILNWTTDLSPIFSFF